MSKTAMIRARVDPILKEEVETILQTIGLSTTQAITLFYQQVRLSRGLPFDLRLPNASTQQTFVDTDAGENLVRCQNADDLFDRLGI
jgi:DNA-damage-inducible protein J